MKRTFLVLLALAALFSSAPGRQYFGARLPEDRGTAGALQAIEKLPVYAHILWTQAHPDDESAGTLTWLARGQHARTAVYCLTRGDGGQNVLGDEKYEAIGVVRTGEMVGACRTYGVDLFFSTVFEFGFSKSAEETLEKWGHEATLEEMVRFIRRWKPSVILSAFGGTSGDGHGHHRASGILTREALTAAAESSRFPEHAKLGLTPWAAKKLYVRAGRGGGGGSVEVPVGTYDPVLGRSYREIGAEGYSHHASQGNAASWAEPGPAFDRYTLASGATAASQADTSILDGIDTSLESLIAVAGDEREAASFLGPELIRARDAAAEALQTFKPRQPSASAPAILKGREILENAVVRLVRSGLSNTAKTAVEAALREKIADFDEAAIAVLGLYLDARADSANVVPGEKIRVTARLLNRGDTPLRIERIGLSSRKELSAEMIQDVAERLIPADGVGTAVLEASFPESTSPTQPFWYRKSPDENRYHIRDTLDPFAPFNRPEISAEFQCSVGPSRIAVTAPVRAIQRSPLEGVSFVDLQIVPKISVRLLPDIAVQRLTLREQAIRLQAIVVNNDPGGSNGSVRLVAPESWRVSPPSSEFALNGRGTSTTVPFQVLAPAAVQAGLFPVEAVAGAGGVGYREGYRVISYPGNWTRHLYAPARTGVRVVDVQMTPGLKVGYVAGTGDEVPDTLRQLGADVTMLSDDDLLDGDLSGYGAVITGVRAYNVRDALRTANRRVLAYVEGGGRLIVQYNWPFRGDESSFPYAPFPLEISAGDRITVEESPVRLLDPLHPALNVPNKITPADFDGWVQERGLYFASKWDSRYTALLSGNDPGEPPKDGGLLIARVGKGIYVYTAYAWFRQLPAGVPGACRLFANLLSFSP